MADVMARYANRARATVTVYYGLPRGSAHCDGCQWRASTRESGTTEELREAAQGHANGCSALPGTGG